jgi:uncharacterized protein
LAPYRLGGFGRRHNHRWRHLVSCGPAVIERFLLTTSDSETLEARWDSLDDPRFTTVFCHPSPIDGGSMMAPLMIAVTQTLIGRGHRVLRFNFRGVGESSGHYDGGQAEVLDTAAAVAFAREVSDVEIGITGWSFGAAVALQWLVNTKETIPYVGIAPPTESIEGEPPPGPKRIVLGSREQVIEAEAVKTFAIKHGIDLVITPGDHFFHGRGKRIGVLVAEGLEMSG